MPRSTQASRTVAPLAAPVEVKPLPGQVPAGMFVSPRVVDQNALGEFAAALQSLIERAAAQIEPLRAATVGAERALEAIRSAAEVQQARLDQAAATLSSLDARVQQIERMLERATDSASSVRQFQERTDEIIAERTAHFARTIEGVGDEQTKSLRGLVSRADVLVSPSAEALPAVIARAESLLSRSTQAAAQLDSIRQQTESARTVLGQSLVVASDETDRFRREHDSLQESLRDAVDLCRSAQSILEARTSELRGASESVSETVAAHRELITRLAEMIERLEPWRGVLLEPQPGSDGAEAPPLPPAIAGIVDSLRHELSRQLGAFSGALSELSAGAARASGRL
ncbi:MAG: hypothetical protein KF745_14420 [Phycisphaeraceae bacterium]|nr:hypothetical protein [Phycisphaeraceae bacterium]